MAGDAATRAALCQPPQHPGPIMTDSDTPSGLHSTAEAPMRTAVILPWTRRGRQPCDQTRAEARLAEAVGPGRLDRRDRRPYRRSCRCASAARRPCSARARSRWSGQAIERAATSAVVVVDAALSPVQQRNLERAWGCKVIDRTGLILEIFGERAAHAGRRAAGRTRASGLPAHAAWCGPGPTSSASAAASASSAAPAKRRSRPTAA